MLVEVRCSPLHVAQTGSGPTQPFIQWIPGVFFLKAKAAVA
jgi:hypothetical protein